MNKANQIILEKELEENLIHEIAVLESEVFHKSLAWEESELRHILGMSDTISVIAYDENARIAGYLLAVNLSDEIEELKEADPEILEIPNALYLNNIVVRPDTRGKGIFSLMVQKFLNAVPDKTIALHASTANSSSVGMQKNGARFVRRIENWYGSGEPFDYLIFDPKK